jgi:TolB protein
VQSADGQEVWQLTSDPKDASPVWSPDGEQVAFVHRQHDHWEIYIVDLTTGRQTRLTDTLALADGSVANSVSPAWSPDGNYLAFLTDRAGEWEIWVMAADGSDPGPLFGAELDALTLDYAFGGERAIDWTE